MPTFEYSCQSCEILFEELLLQREEVETYREWHPCPQCGQRAEREKMSVTNFAFQAPAGQTAGSGVHGQSGVHDLDYPKLDKAVGRSANVKWQYYNKRKEERDKVRREAGTNAITQTPDSKPVAADSSTMAGRDKAMKSFSTIKKLAENG